MFKNKKSPLIIAGILLLYCLILSSVNFISYYKDGVLLGTKLYQDTSYHLMRLQSIYDGLKGGQFPVMIYPNTLNGYGYASPLFYPDLFLYLPACWMLLGMKLAPAYCIFLTVLAFFSAFFFYLFARKIVSEPFAVASGMLFIGGNYTYSVFFYMNAVGQASAVCFTPLLLLGIYNMLKEDFNKPWILLLGVLGITYSHTISLFLWGIALVVIVLFNFRKCFLSKKWWIKVVSMIVLYIGLSSAYLLPMLEQMLSTDFYQKVSPWAFLSNQATPWEWIFVRYWDVPLTSKFTEYSIGIIVPLSFLLRILVRPEKSRRIKIDLMIGAVILSQFVASSLFPWKIFEGTILNAIQFPSRLLMLTAPLSALSVGMILEELKVHPIKYVPKILSPILAGLLLVTTAAFDCYFLPPDGKTDLDTESLYSYVGGGEWYPVYEDCYSESGIVYVLSTRYTSIRNKKGKKIPFERKENSVEFSFVGEENMTYEIPLIYYKGYTAIDENGTQLEVSHDGYGQLLVHSKEAGEVKVLYGGTILQTVTKIVSIVTIPISVAYYIYESKKRIRP